MSDEEPPCQCGGAHRGVHYTDGRECLLLGLPVEHAIPVRPAVPGDTDPVAGVDADGFLLVHDAPAEAPQPILTRWLEGESLDDLGADEQALRVELAEMQADVREMQHDAEIAVAQRNTYAENARKLHHLIHIISQNVEKEAVCYGEWDPDPERHGFLQGRGSALHVYQRTLDWLGNLVRARAHHDGGATK